MKKYLIVLLAVLLLATFPIVAYATTESPEISPTEGIEAETATVGGETEENAAVEDYASENWFAEAKDWCAEHFSGIIVSLAALYAVLPKVGGIAALLKIAKGIFAAFTILKTYIDDEKNENSIYNVLKRQGDMVANFMNNVSPTLAKIESGLSALKASATSQDKLRGALLTVEEAVELMAKEFSDLISISTTVSQKKKAEMEAAWMEAEAHLRAAVKEALNDEAGEKENA